MPGFVESCVAERLNKLKDFDSTQDLLGKQLVERGLCDPCRLFVKQEPHKAAKLTEGRVRLIASISIIDNIICRMLCGLQNETEINSWQDIPSKPGMGLTDENLSDIDASVRAEMANGSLAEADISGWDFSMQGWDFEADLERRTRLNKGRDTIWYRIAKAHFYCMQRKLFIISDGRMFEQQRPGIMPSGWYNTSSTNSYVRNLTSYLVQSQASMPVSLYGIANGDDSIERYIPEGEAASLYASLGKICKMYNRIEEVFEFCSMRFEKRKLAVPVNIDKLLVNLFSQPRHDFKELEMHYEEFLENIRNMPTCETNELVELVKASGFLLRGEGSEPTD
jgi:hypothetical protein